MPPPDILSDISRHDKYDQMSDVICQLSDVLGQRDKMMSRGTSGVRRTEEEEDAETMSDVQSCLNYIDGLLATPEMINIPERGTNSHVIITFHLFTWLILRIDVGHVLELAERC